MIENQLISKIREILLNEMIRIKSTTKDKREIDKEYEKIVNELVEYCKSDYLKKTIDKLYDVIWIDSDDDFIIRRKERE